MDDHTQAHNRSWLIGLLGEHVVGSLTPGMHEAEARRQGMLLSYRFLDSVFMRQAALRGENEPEGTVNWPRLVDLARDLTFDGLNVTHPAKQLVQPVLDELSDDAELLGAVNTIRFEKDRAVGMNTDHAGFSEALASMSADGRGEADLSKVVQMGAGGAGSAVIYALLRAGAKNITVIDVDQDRARALIERMSRAFDVSGLKTATLDEAADEVRSASGLVNSTPIGMTGVSETSPVDVDALHPNLWVGDVVYRPLKTVLVTTAEAKGCRAFSGAEMAVGQAVVAFEHFTGLPADRESMREAFRIGAKEQWGLEF